MAAFYGFQQVIGALLLLLSAVTWTVEGSRPDVKQTWMASRGLDIGLQGKGLQRRSLKDLNSTNHHGAINVTNFQPSIVNANGHNCSTVAHLDRLILVAGDKYDPSWLHELSLPYIRYQPTHPHGPHHFVDNANEAGAYLKFILDYYDCLPKAVAFIHGHDGEGWHNFDMKETLLGIKWDSVHNFTDINKKPGTWEVELADAPARPKKAVAFGEDVYNGSFNTQQIINGVAYDLWEAHLWLMSQSYIRMYDKHFGPEGLGALPAKLKFTCCAQFLVPREAMLMRPRSFYENTLQYLVKNDIRGNTHVDGKYVLGDGIAIFWGLIFGNADAEPTKPCSQYTADMTPARCALVKGDLSPI